MLRTFLSLCFLAGFALQGNLVSAQAPIARLKQANLNEDLQDESPVSGRVVAGVVALGPSGAYPLRLEPPPSAAGSNICIQVVSRDGRYWSKNTFELPGDFGSGPVALDYNSKYTEFLKTLAFGDLAILGSPGECGATATDTMYLAGSTPTGGAGPGIGVFVNSGRMDTYLAVTNIAELKRPARCERIERGRRTGFDTMCRIDLTTVGSAPASLDVRILRRHYERMLPPTEFRLLLPGRQ